jgi:hypothetical protein
MIKKIFIYTLGIVLTTSVSCSDKFDEINVNPTMEDNPPTSALLTQSMLQTSTFEYEAWRGNLIYTTLFVQQFASLSWQGDKYLFSEDYSSALWSSYYPQAVKTLTDIIERTMDNPDEVNYQCIARIQRVFVFQRITDLYGDVPYSEAGRGFTGGILLPKYDSQSSIYDSFLEELQAAATSFDASKTAVLGDIIYSGDLALWKKAAYSLMLRVAMRLSEADPEKAEEWAAKAIAGGVFDSYQQSMKVAHLESTYDNPNSHVLGYYPSARQEIKNQNFKFSKTYIDLLKANNDIRLGILPVLGYYLNEQGDTVELDYKTIVDGLADPAYQTGLPNGLDPNTLKKPVSRFSQLRSDFVQADAPNILVSHAQTLFLKAEAIERGWVEGNAEETFRDGVLSAVNQLKLYEANPSLFNDEAIANFAAAIDYPVEGTLDEKLEAINTQYYLVSLLDGYESFANWRRSGYPALTPVNYPGNVTGGTIPRRLQYPATESGVNGANLEAAIGRQGANDFTTRVWWDKD